MLTNQSVGSAFLSMTARMDVRWVALVMLVALFSYGAWGERGVFEDGFIFLRVIENLASGHGMVYNPGYREGTETTTDFLFTLLGGALAYLGVPSIVALHSISIIAYMGCMTTTWVVSTKLAHDNKLVPFVAVVLLGTHYTFTRFAASGFGVGLQAFALLLSLLALIGFVRKGSLQAGFLLGLSMSVLILCRLDSAVFVMPMAVAAVYATWQQGRGSVPGLLTAGTVASMTLLVLLAWKTYYYGDIYPATYYTKARASVGEFDQRADLLDWGLKYLLSYWSMYLLFVMVTGAAVGACLQFKSGSVSREANACKACPAVRMVIIATMVAMVAMQHLYMLRTGGDYYGFRMLMPQAPLLMVLIALGWGPLQLRWQAFMLLTAVLASAFYMETGILAHGSGNLQHDIAWPDEYEKETDIQAHDHRYIERFIHVGKALQKLSFADDPTAGTKNTEIIIATPNLGAIGYYSQMHAIETHGLNDVRVANANADQLWLDPSENVGHRQIARPGLLASLSVNLVVSPMLYSRAAINLPTIGNTNAMPEEIFHAWASIISESPPGERISLPRDSQLLILPINDELVNVILYLVRSEKIDAHLERLGIVRYGLYRPANDQHKTTP